MTPAASPWAGLAGGVVLPAWSGPARTICRLDVDPAPLPRAKTGPVKGSKRSPNGTRKPRASRAKEARELRQLQRRAQEAVLQVLPAWSLIEPGSARESLAHQVPPSWWWPRG